MTRLNLDTSIPLPPREALSASASASGAAAGRPGSFHALLHQAAEAVNGSPSEPPLTASKPDQAADSQGSSASPPNSAGDAPPPSGDSNGRTSDKATDYSPAASATSAVSAEAQAATASTPTSASGTQAGKGRGDGDENDSSAPTANAQSPLGVRAKAAAATGAQPRAAKNAGGKPGNTAKKTASSAAAEEAAAAIAQNATEASSPLSSTQDAAVPRAKASAQAPARDGNSPAAAQAVQAASLGITGANATATGDAATSTGGPLAADATTAAANADADPPQDFGRAAGKSAADRRGNTPKAFLVDSNASTARTGGTTESPLTGTAADPSNQSASVNPVGVALSGTEVLDPPKAAGAAKSGVSAAVKSIPSPAASQTQNTKPAQDPSGLGAPATETTGQAAAGSPATDASGQAATGASQADRVRLVQRVAAAFQSVGDQGGTVRLRLSPPDLGAVKLEVSVHNGAMSARLETETSAARSLLLDNLPALRDRLAQQQIKVERFDVDLAGQSSGGMPQGANQQARQQSQPYSAAKQSRSAGPQQADSASALPAVRTAARGRFDVTI
jgi:flagellar hook-length control protein FliK